MNLAGVEIFLSKMQRESLSSFSCLERRRPVSTIKKRSATLKKAMVDKHSKWQGEAWRQSTEQWKGAHSSQDVWKSTSSDVRWTDVTKEMDHLKKVIHEKQTTWNKSMKETSQRDNDLLKTMECAVDDERQEYKDKCALAQIGVPITHGRGRSR